MRRMFRVLLGVLLVSFSLLQSVAMCAERESDDLEQKFLSFVESWHRDIKHKREESYEELQAFTTEVIEKLKSFEACENQEVAITAKLERAHVYKGYISLKKGRHIFQEIYQDYPEKWQGKVAFVFYTAPDDNPEWSAAQLNSKKRYLRTLDLDVKANDFFQRYRKVCGGDNSIPPSAGIDLVIAVQLSQQEKWDEAKVICQRLVQKFPNTSLARDASLLLESMRIKKEYKNRKVDKKEAMRRLEEDQLPTHIEESANVNSTPIKREENKEPQRKNTLLLSFLIPGAIGLIIIVGIYALIEKKASSRRR